MYHPIVMDEADTIRALLDPGKRHRGMARWGDGRFGVMRGWKDVYQICEYSLSEALAHRLACPAPGVLNCLPRPVTAQESGNDPHSLPSIRWQSYWQANCGVFPLLPRVTYGFSYFSRMDSVPQYHKPWFWDLVAELWKGQDICLVAGSERSLTPTKLLESPGAPRTVEHVLTPSKNGWSVYPSILEQVKKADKE